MAQAKRSPVARFSAFLFRCLLWYLAITFALVLLYRFVPVPTTLTMLFDSNGSERDWEPLSNISPNLVRAVIAAEDGKFCQHNGFDTEAIEKAIQRNQQGAASAAAPPSVSRPRRMCSCGKAAAGLAMSAKCRKRISPF